MRIINIDKPKGWTSYDVVRLIKRKFKENKVGHLGTLDPMATGVLPVFLGKATRLIPLFNESVFEHKVNQWIQQPTHEI